MTTLPLFPLHGVLLPGATMPIHVFEPRYWQLLRRCRDSGETFGIVLIRRGREVADAALPFEVGTEAAIVAVEDLPGARANVLVEGRRRFRITGLVSGKPYLEGEVEWLREEAGDAEEWRRTVLDLLRASGERPIEVALDRDAVALSFRLAHLLAVSPAEKQELLQAEDAAQRLSKEAVLLLRTGRQRRVQQAT